MSSNYINYRRARATLGLAVKDLARAIPEPVFMNYIAGELVEADVGTYGNLAEVMSMALVKAGAESLDAAEKTVSVLIDKGTEVWRLRQFRRDPAKPFDPDELADKRKCELRDRIWDDLTVFTDKMNICSRDNRVLRISRLSPSDPEVGKLESTVHTQNKWNGSAYAYVDTLSAVRMQVNVPTNWTQTVKRTNVYKAFMGANGRYGLPLTAEYKGTEDGVDVHRCRWVTWSKKDKAFTTNDGFVCVGYDGKLASYGTSVQGAKKSLTTVARRKMSEILAGTL